jgi:Ras-related protein Rab-1A
MYSHAWDHFYKIVMIGNSSVGKTCMIKRFVDDVFNSKDFISTVGIDFSTKMIEIKDTNVEDPYIKDKKIKLQIWDTAGQERFRAITSTYYRIANGIIVVYDITNRESFDQVNYWLDEIHLHREHVSIPKVLVGNKKDLDKDKDKDKDKDVNERKVTTEEGRSLALKNKMIFFETSAFTGENVNEVFNALTKCILMQKTKAIVQQNIAFSKNHPLPKNHSSLPKKSCCL